MLIILASGWNESARALASRFAHEGVRILTPRDLSVAGWRQRIGGVEACVAVVDGKRVPQGEISAVLTQLPAVVEQELMHIVPIDRSYVAAEMSAFLLFWLSQLDCPVLNRPTPTCLSGPGWRKEKWVQVAFQAGIPARPVSRIAAPSNPADTHAGGPNLTTVTVIGVRTFGEADPSLHRHAQRLARIAQVDLLSVRFSGNGAGAEFIDADTFPDLSEDRLAVAVLEHLCGAAGVRT